MWGEIAHIEKQLGVAQQSVVCGQWGNCGRASETVQDSIGWTSVFLWSLFTLMNLGEEKLKQDYLQIYPVLYNARTLLYDSLVKVMSRV